MTKEIPDDGKATDLLQERIGYKFSRPELLVQALTHRSHGNSHNERLEFLGDSVLSCAVSAALYRRYSRLTEGELSRMRASLVRQDSLHQVALSLSLTDAVRLGEGELKVVDFNGLQSLPIL